MEQESATANTSYAGSMPAIYDACLGDFLFAPFADDLVSRAVAAMPFSVLETASGTGIVTERLSRQLPGAQIIATDLSPDMLFAAQQRVSSPNVQFRVVDAQELPFEDAAFDLVACQFGAMFFPEPVIAYSAARRVIGADGQFMFTVWDRIEKNPASHIVELAVASMFPRDPPTFLSRKPYGYHGERQISEELRRAGFGSLEHHLVEITSEVRDPQLIARGLCEGCPLSAEIEQRQPGALPEAISLASDALESAGFRSGSVAPLSAHLWIASA